MSNPIFRLFCLITISFIYSFSSINATTSDSDWKTLYSYAGNVTQMELSPDRIYGVSDGKLFGYHLDDQSFDNFPQLYNDNITAICYASDAGCLALGYSDSNIQLLYDNGNVVTIAGLKNTQWNLDKTINNISVSGNKLFVSTNFGLVVIDINKAVITESCILNAKVYSAAQYNNSIYIATSVGVLTANESVNIQDRSNWTTLDVRAHYSDTDVSFTNTEITKICVYKNKLHFLVKGKMICVMENDTTFVKALTYGPTDMNTFSNNQKLLAYKENVLYVFDDLYSFKYTYPSLGKILSVAPGNSNTYWVGCDGSNLSQIQLKNGSDQAEVLQSKLYMNGPLSNYPFAMLYQNNKLYVVGGAFYTNRYKYDAAYSFYDGSSWSNSDLTQIKTINSTAKDFVSLAVDPTDPLHVFVSSWGEGLYEFNGTECIKLYDSSNSPLQDIFSGNNYTRVAGLCYDSNNNLWIGNTMVDYPIKMLTSSGTWKQYALPAIDDIILSRICIDRNGTKWIGSSYLQGTLFIWKDNGTVDDTSDDVSQYISTFADQDGTSLTLRSINAIREDMDGNIWLATTIGPFKIYNSSNIASKNIVLNKIKIPRNDGTDYVDILLENVQINDMVIDGANQKWFATESSGVYLISADGLSTIYHFTKDNSILPSNRILSLAMDKKNGIIYIGTERGIVSFNSKYVSGSSNYSSVYSYPNPVRPGYTGDITIKGLKYDSSVKITDLNGNIINIGTSAGGTYIWDGKDIRGIRVKTGVYLVFAASEDGSEGVVTKIMVVQ